MHLTARSAFEALFSLGTLSSLGFYLVAACGIGSFLRAKRQRNVARSGTAHLSPVSLLKPLRGIDPYMWECLSSHCEQDYPDFELIFGVSDAADPAIELVRRLQQHYPNRRIELVICDRALGTNTKVSNLAQMLPQARHEVLLVDDSDIRVPPDYLRRVVTPLSDDSIGLVTCLYRGIASRTLGSKLECLTISTDFVPGVLSARFLEHGLHFGLGSTLALRRTDLTAIGGFEVMVDYLADDYELGRRLADLGKRIELSDVVVETFLPSYSLLEFLTHQLRWSRTIRGARRWGYAGLFLTFGFMWSVGLLLVTRGELWDWALASITVGARVTIAMATGSAILGDGQVWRNFYLLPLRDLIAPVVWALSFAGNRISWRGDVFRVKDGRLARLKHPVPD